MHQFHDPEIGALAALARSLNARMEEGSATGAGTGTATVPAPTTGAPPNGNAPQTGQSGQTGQGDPAADNAEAWKNRSREWERKAKANADAAKELDALKKAQMTELEKAQAEAAEAKARATQAELAAARQSVATAKGLPAGMAERLQGSTKEELEADADVLLKVLARPAGNGARPDLRQGARGGTSTEKVDGNTWLREQALRRR